MEQVLALAWFILIPVANCEGYPTLRGSLTQNVESHEKKRVEFLLGPKRCKRVRKDVNPKGIARNEEHRLAGLKIEGGPPYVFETI